MKEIHVIKRVKMDRFPVVEEGNSNEILVEKGKIDEYGRVVKPAAIRTGN
jgi:hypothetical protein